MSNITLSMIVKNEEKYLSGCLESVKNIVDEIVIVDTGSTDNTLSIAEKYNAKIFHFEWVKDFAAARNFALSKSNGKYILYLDADERLSNDSIEEVKILAESNSKKLIGYNCTVESASEASGGANVMQYIRFFANHPEIRFAGKAHEQIEDSLIENGYSILNSGIKIIHLGYDVSEDELKNKARRNLKLLVDDYEQAPTSYKSFQIGQTYVVLGELIKSESYFIYAIENKNLKDSHLAHCYRYLAAIESNIKNDLEKSLDYVNAGLKISHKQPLLNVIASNIYLRKNMFSEAEEFARKAFKYNVEIQNSNIDFEIKIKEEDLLNHVLNIAMLSCNVKLFNDFYKIYKSEQNEANRNKLLLLFNSVFNNYSIEENIIEESNYIVSSEFIPAYMFSLSNYNNVKVRIKLLGSINKKYPHDVKTLNMLGNSYLEIGNKPSAFNCFEESFKKSNNDQALLFSLITLCVDLNQMDKLLKYINSAELLFKDNNAILDKLLNIKEKINSVSN